MATSYTYKIVENGQSFEEFATTCLRAFGICIHMRDDPLDTPIPENFEPDPYYKNALEDARAKYEAFMKMSADEQMEFVENELNMSIQNAKNSLKTVREQNQRVRDMIQLVKKFTPPEGYADWKKFMIEQLEMSFSDELFYINLIESASSQSAKDVLEQHIKQMQDNIEYYEKSWNAEVQRANERTKAMKAVRTSIKDFIKTLEK